jgi:hypothetical protein
MVCHLIESTAAVLAALTIGTLVAFCGLFLWGCP